MTRTGRAGRGRAAVPFVAPTVRRVIVAETAAVAIGWALFAAHVRPGPALLAAAAVALVPFVAVRRRSVVDWVRTIWRFLADRVPDVGVSTNHTDTAVGPVGVHWQRDTVTCTIEIVPPGHATTVLGKASAETQHTLPVDALASCLRQHDIEVCSIDVVALGFRSSAGSVATEVYESLIGPLPAVAVRTVWVAVTLDLRANARAIGARGGGRAGAARAAVVATTRVHRALNAHGLSSRLLTSSEVRSAVLHLCRGVSIDDLTQTWSTAPLPGASSTGFGIDCSTVTAEDIATLWATPSLGATLSFRLQPTHDTGKVRIHGSCRFATRTPITKPRVRALTSMSGSQRDGILAQLPLALPALDSLSPSRILDTTTMDELKLPVGGCGQLLGSDAHGHGVAVRLFGPGLTRVRIAGELYLAQQLIFRAIATGARVLVRTDRPHAWSAILDAIGAPDRLLIDGTTTRSRPSYDVILIDFADGSAPPVQQGLSGVTVISLSEHLPRTGRPEQNRSVPQPDLTIVQPHASGDRIHVRSGPLDVELTLVTIPQETAFIGRPRSLRPAVRA
ncbi:type VII secretion protein EccE [Rhodococcus sp. 05-2254-6]|uniref:type VII secretion protein EccE n=1 Tax=Rhodococcus sp. 05-2254-6 TaxID=2022489 RepID=UPI000B9B10C6|nr:type VII secretion protein EccE [Rhodococcus sp. 05-2254-6]OZE33891.1 type VII secretion protein EccE [Rhodococcus sp. 05-2254-6]